MCEKKLKFVEQPIGPAPYSKTVDPDTISKYYETINLEHEVACLMLSSMSPDQQRTLEKYNAFNMMKELKTMLEKQANHELFEIVKAFHACYEMPNELSVSLILNSLNKDYDQFVHNYNMHRIGKTIAKLHAILKLYEKGIPKKVETPTVLAIREGHSKRNCLSYHDELKKRKNANVASTSGIFNIELYAFPNKNWVYDTDYGTHICNTSQGLRESRKLKHGALSVYIGNGIHVEVEAIRSFDLVLPSGLIIVLDTYHFAPTVTRGVVLIYCLVKNDRYNLYPNVCSLFKVSEKKAKRALDSSYLWHCRLSHINKKRMDKLQHD
nr:hypothetical protein [Tanacetum cinerariifolium]